MDGQRVAHRAAAWTVTLLVILADAAPSPAASADDDRPGVAASSSPGSQPSPDAGSVGERDDDASRGAAEAGAPEAGPPTTGASTFPQALPADGANHLITRVRLEYFDEHSRHPSEADVLAATIDVTRTTTGWVQPLPGEPVRAIALSEFPRLAEQRFHDSALTLIVQAVATRLQQLDLLGAYAEFDASQFRVADDRVVDLRREGVTSATIFVTTGVISEVRTSALGDRLNDEEDELINNAAHAGLIERSPVRVDDDAGAERPLLRRRAIEDYALFLSRHPGRRVDISIAPSAVDPGAVTLDYLVTENKPWLVYAQLSNTGTESTEEWRERVGFIHNQLTNNDDILSLEYVTNSFEGTNAFVGSYDRPLADDGRLRGRAYGSWYEYDASAVGQPGADFEGDGYSLGGELVYNAVQHRDVFLDVVGGLRFDSIDVDNQLAGVEGDDSILIGYGGVRVERALGVNQTRGEAIVEFSLDGLDGDSENTLGRAEADDGWVLLRGGVSHSLFLETIFHPEWAESGSLAHEVFASVSGQTSFGNRLAPNYQQIAGGLYSVRGYPQAVTAGDDVVLATGEYRFHLPRALSPQPEAGEFLGEPFRWRPQYQAGPVDWDFITRVFIDVARTENADRLAFETDETLVGAGFGFELSIRRNLNARIDFGWALAEIENEVGQTVVDKGDNEVHVVLTLVY